MYNVKKPTNKQIKYAKDLGIEIQGKSFRVLSAEIEDKLEMNSFEYIEKMKLKPGMKVKYIGNRKNLPIYLTISSIAKNGFVFFKGSSKYCRPWSIIAVKMKEQ